MVYISEDQGRLTAEGFAQWKTLSTGFKRGTNPKTGEERYLDPNGKEATLEDAKRAIAPTLRPKPR